MRHSTAAAVCVQHSQRRPTPAAPAHRRRVPAADLAAVWVRPRQVFPQTRAAMWTAQPNRGGSAQQQAGRTGGRQRERSGEAWRCADRRGQARSGGKGKQGGAEQRASQRARGPLWPRGSQPPRSLRTTYTRHARVVPRPRRACATSPTGRRRSSRVPRDRARRRPPRAPSGRPQRSVVPSATGVLGKRVANRFPASGGCSRTQDFGVCVRLPPSHAPAALDPDCHARSPRPR